MVVSLPNLNHISKADYEAVYEPSEDTYLFMDALETQLKFLKNIKAFSFVEIGPGSGCISTFLASIVHIGVFFAVDINLKAAQITERTGEQNKVKINVINASLLSSLRDNSVDVLYFNPPYVPSEPEELNSTGIEAAWAGGENGREVIDQLLPDVSVSIKGEQMK